MRLGREHTTPRCAASGVVLPPLQHVCGRVALCSDLRTPFGGMKDSGTGREGGKYSLEFYSETKNVCIYLGRP